MFMNKLKSKKLGYWLACVAAIVALVGMIIFGVYKGRHGGGSGAVYAFIIIGILMQVALFIYDGKLGPVLSIGAPILYALALGYSIKGGVGNIVDLFSGVVCFGIPELAPLNFAIAAILAVSILLSIVSCFLRREKAKE